VEKSNDLFIYLESLRSRDSQNLKNYLKRFLFLPSVKGKKVMDFGCGQGLLSLHLLSDGASEVIGVDNDKEIIEYANLKVPSNLRSEKIKFTTSSVSSMKSDYFDFIFTKDAFEHCYDFEDILYHLHRILKPGGLMVVGFGPLWNSPFGDHKILHAALGFSLPWLHLLLPDEVLKNLFNNSSMDSKKRIRKSNLDKVDRYLNKITLDRFFHAVEENNFSIIYKNINAHQNNFLNSLGKLKALFFLGKYWERNAYCILKKV